MTLLKVKNFLFTVKCSKEIKIIKFMFFWLMEGEEGPTRMTIENGEKKKKCVKINKRDASESNRAQSERESRKAVTILFSLFIQEN